MSTATQWEGLAEVQQRVEELRGCARTVYQYQQNVAPVHGGQLPHREDFFRVTCQDISRGGVSFIVDDEPDYESVVIALGPSQTVLYVAAKVCNVTPISAVNGLFYRVGCEFTERVRL